MKKKKKTNLRETERAEIRKKEKKQRNKENSRKYLTHFNRQGQQIMREKRNEEEKK